MAGWKQTWGQVLVGFGIISVAVGACLAASSMLIVQPGGEPGLTVGEIVGVSLLCCFGPGAILGLVLLLVGAVMWINNQR